MKTSGRTPYEIRLELLQLAWNILHARHEAIGHERAASNGGTILITTSPTTEEVIVEAEKMNSFISNTA